MTPQKEGPSCPSGWFGGKELTFLRLYCRERPTYVVPVRLGTSFTL